MTKKKESKDSLPPAVVETAVVQPAVVQPPPEVALKPVARPPSGRATVQALFERSSGELTKALGGQMGTERFIRAALTAYSNGSDYFRRADPVTFLGACIQAAQLSLSIDPILGESYLIPRKNNRKGRIEINFQLGYKGLLKLSRRNHNFLSAHAEVVYEGDHFEYDLGSEPHVAHHKSMNRSEAPTDDMIIASYAVVRYHKGAAQIHVSPRWEILAARDRSDAFQRGDGPWLNFFSAMAKLPPLRAILKLEAIDDIVLRQLGREDEQERTGEIIEIGLDGEAIPVDDTPSLTEAPSSIDDLKARFGKQPDDPKPPDTDD